LLTRGPLATFPDTDGKWVNPGDIMSDPVRLGLNRLAAHYQNSVRETPIHPPVLPAFALATPHPSPEHPSQMPRTLVLLKDNTVADNVSSSERPFVHPSDSEAATASIVPYSDTARPPLGILEVKSRESISMQTLGSGVGGHISRFKSVRLAPHKRRRGASSYGANGGDEGDTSSEEGSASSTSVPYARRGARDTRVFACPFWKMDPTHHMDCLTRRLTRIRDVKQHLQRKHYQSTFYCPICCKQFTGPRDRDEHVRFQSCKTRALTGTDKHDFVSQEAQGRLKHRLSRSASPEKQWYTVWDILFWDKPRPESPYLGAMLEEASAMIRDFWQRECSEIVRRFLDTRPERASCDRATLKQLLSDLIDEIQLCFHQKIREDISSKRPLSNPNSHAQSTTIDYERLELGRTPTETLPSLNHSGRCDTQMQFNYSDLRPKSSACGWTDLPWEDVIGEAGEPNVWDARTENQHDYITTAFLATSSWEQGQELAPAPLLSTVILTCYVASESSPTPQMIAGLILP
jgi:hypothetical protein